MVTRPKSVRLAPRYDAARLKADVDGLVGWARVQPGPFSTAGWTGISLVQGEGRADDTRSPRPSVRGPLPTPALEVCPALRDLLADLPGPVLVARLLFLEPGGRADLHRDPVGFPVGVVRLHVPIVTHPDVELWIGGERQRWDEGELWYGDFAFPHRLANPSAVTRVHLVVDVCASDALLALFPEGEAAACRAGGVYVHRAARAMSPALARLEGRLALPPFALAGVWPHEAIDLRRAGDVLEARAPGEEAAAFVLEPISDAALGLRGYYPGVTFDVAAGGAVELVHRGRVSLPEGTPDDDPLTPWELFTTRWEIEHA